MRRALLVPLLALFAIPSSAAGPQRALKELYSSGDLAAAIPDGGTLENTLTVRRRGEVAHVAVSVRLDHARDSDLSIHLVAPNGKSVLLSAANGNGGANYGAGSRDCRGTPTDFSDGGTVPITAGAPPFVGALYKPQQPLAWLAGSRTDGIWKLRVTDGAAGATGTLFCWTIVLERRRATVETGRARATSAELSYVRQSANQHTLNARLRITRAGKLLYDRGFPTGCSECEAWPTGYYGGSSLRVRDLDRDGEPEVLVDFYTGGAHCCFFTRIYRYVPGRYVGLLHFWGNPSYRLAHLDRDRRPEFLSYDDRFAYAFSCFACSGFPVQIWDYRAGKMLDVTRRFPVQIRTDARGLWRTYTQARRQHYDYSGILPAWLADEYMLGRGAAAWEKFKAIVAVRRFVKDNSPWKRGPYLRAVRSFLRRTGYTR
jgi:subtilisin-like proprotein convertase family protein